MKNLRLKSKTPKNEEIVFPNILFLSKPRKKRTIQETHSQTQKQLKEQQESKIFTQFVIKRSYTRQPSPIQTSPRQFENFSSLQGVTSRTDRISSGLTNSTDVMTTQTLIKQHKNIRKQIQTINERTEEDVQNQRQLDVLGTFIIMDSKNSVNNKIFSKLPRASNLQVSYHSNYSLKMQKCLKNFMALPSTPQILGRRKQSILWDKGDNPFTQKIDYKNSQQVFKLYFVQKLEVYVKKQKILQFEIASDFNMEDDYIEFNHRASLKHIDKIKKFYFPQQQENYQQPKHKGFMYQYDINANKLQDKKIHFDIWIDDDIQYLEQELDHFTNDYYQNEDIQNVDFKINIFQMKDVSKPVIQTNFILSEVDEVPKNYNLSEYDQEMDQSIYESNLNERLPSIQIFYKGNQLRRQLAKLYYLKFPEILSGRYSDQSVLVDFEHQEPVQVVIDKKKMMMNMKNKNLQSKQSKRQLLEIPNSSTRSLMGRKTKQNIQLSKSFDCLDDIPKCGSDKASFKSLKSLEEESQVNFGFSFRNQMRLNYYQFFDDLIKSNRTPIEIASKLIQHNLLHELQTFTKNVPNFRLDEKTHDGTPLIAIAAKSGNTEVVQYLLQSDTNIDAQDQDGNTALHHALAMRNFPIADILISQGANALIRNKLKQDAFKMAQN